MNIAKQNAAGIIVYFKDIFIIFLKKADSFLFSIYFNSFCFQGCFDNCTVLVDLFLGRNFTKI